MIGGKDTRRGRNVTSGFPTRIRSRRNGTIDGNSETATESLVSMRALPTTVRQIGFQRPRARFQRPRSRDQRPETFARDSRSSRAKIVYQSLLTDKMVQMNGVQRTPGSQAFAMHPIPELLVERARVERADDGYVVATEHTE